MKTIRSISAATRFCAQAKGPVVFVPTMGALHRGHATLIDEARKRAGAEGTVVVSIFVNPTQFGPREDFSRYPRPLAADQKLCAAHGVDMIFHPSAEEMYPEGYSTYVDETTASTRLCGASRPGHFRGVCTVVLKLFQIIRPEMAVFGLKDFQQCTVIRRMVKDLHVPVKILPVATVRESNGLALSSRNQYLSEEERAQAVVLNQALRAAEAAWKKGERSAARLRGLVVKTIEKVPLARIDYVEVGDAKTLEAVTKVERNSVIAVAVFFGKTRLIDNVWLR